MIDPTGGTDFSQPQKIGAPAHAVAEKVSEVKEPRKAERSPDSRLNSRNDRKNKHSGSKKKGFSLYV